MNNENLEIQNNDDSNPLFDIIQNLQSKLGTNDNTPNDISNINPNNTSGSSDFNFNNVLELLKGVGTQNSQLRK